MGKTFNKSNKKRAKQDISTRIATKRMLGTASLSTMAPKL